MPSIWRENKHINIKLIISQCEKNAHMQLCHMWVDICTNQHTVLITHHVKCSFSDSKMPEPKFDLV